MQSRALTLKFYRRLCEALPFHALDDKLFGVVFLATNLPLVALALFVLMHGEAPVGATVLLVLLATLSSAGLSLWAVHHLLAPLRMATRALHVYSTEKRVLPLPTDLRDEMGELLRDVRRTLESVEEGRARLEQLSSEDPMTGLPSRRMADAYLKLAATATERSGGRLSVAVMGLERFHALNEQLGTDAGDRALRKVGDFLKLWLKRKTDWVARWTGDEFIAVLFADQNSAFEYLENLRREFARQMRGFEGVTLSLSIGIAEQHRHEDIALCVKRAELALRHAGDKPDAGVATSPPVKVRSIVVAANSA